MSNQQPPISQADIEARAYLLHTARVILLAVPPPVALAFCLEAFDGMSEIKAPEGVELNLDVAILKHACAAFCKGTESLPESAYDIPDEHDWIVPLMGAIGQYAPGAPGALYMVSETILRVLSGSIPQEALSLPKETFVVPEATRTLAVKILAYTEACASAARSYFEKKVVGSTPAAPTSATTSA